MAITPSPRLVAACQSFLDGSLEWGDIEIEAALIECGLMSEEDMVESCEESTDHTGAQAVFILISNGAGIKITPSTGNINRC